MLEYKCLNRQEFQIDEYKIVPIRFEDRYNIMKWRNEQMYHLRQSKILTIEDQDLYFENVVSKLFEKEKPDQILFSFLENDKCIGYGGVVHIDWKNKNGEISFLLNTELNTCFLDKYFIIFLKLVEIATFNYLHLHKLYTYAYDLRPEIYKIFESQNYVQEAILKEHIIINNTFIDVVIHGKTRQKN